MTLTLHTLFARIFRNRSLQLRRRRAPAVAVEALETRVVCSAVPVSPSLDVPVLHSLPGAPVSLYIDFDGDFTEDWAGAHPGLTPAFDIDGDTASFSADELRVMEHVWQRVAEMYSPFNIDVTTQDPGSTLSEQTMRIVVGGDGAWGGGTAGGLSELDSFSDPNRVNLSWAFVIGTVVVEPLSKSPGAAALLAEPTVFTTEKTIADTVAHEAGHAFGLLHQRTFNPDGSVLSEYNGGDPLRAPIMGTAAMSERALWWIGPAISPTEIQEDLAVLTREINGFGYRPDEAGDTIETAVESPLTLHGIRVSGVITTIADRDIYVFNQITTGHASIRLDVAARSAMLDAAIEVLDESGATVALIDSSSLGEIATVPLSAGRYFVAVRSHGETGDIGQYTLTVHPDVALPDLFSFDEPKPTRPDLDVKLTVRGAADPDGQIQAVRFFFDADGDEAFNPAIDSFLGEVTKFNKKGNGTLILSAELFSPGNNTVFAVPRDDTDADGAALSTIVRVQAPVRLTARPKVVVAGENFELVADDVLIVGTTVSSVDFYRDVNGNGKIDRRDILVGTDTDGSDGWLANVTTDGLTAGNHEFIAIATGANRRKQKPGFTSVFINERPHIGSLTAFHEPQLPFGIYTVQADGLSDSQSEITRVNFYIDNNDNQQLDENDELIGTRTEITGTSTFIRFAPSERPPGTYSLFAVAEDAHGGKSEPATTTLEIA